MKLYRFHDITAPKARRYPSALPEKRLLKSAPITSPTPITHTTSPAIILTDYSVLKNTLSMRIDIIGTNESIIVISATGIYSIAVYSQK